MVDNVEAVIEPALPICDPHHHLWDVPGRRYAVPELLTDLRDGHNVVSTVYVEGGSSYYRAEGPEHLRPVGQTAFLREVQLETARSVTKVAAGIVGFADLMRGAEAGEVLDAHLEATGGTLRAIRQLATRDPNPDIPSSFKLAGPELYERADFRAGITELARRGLAFESWQYFHQLPLLAELGRAFPDLRIVIDHCGGIVGVGSYAGRRDEIFSIWQGHLRELARLPNVWMKIGGLGMDIGGFGFDKRDKPASSEELAAAWQPYVESCITIFGPERCMFESNFPVDRISCSYRTLWNAFKRITGSASEVEKAWLFHDSASRCYRLDEG